MSVIRFGVVGLGAIGAKHARSLANSASRRFVLGGVACTNPQKADLLSRELGVPGFASAEALFKSGTCDAVIIATPHYWHPPLAIAAARAGLHVLAEKPLAVTVGPARQVVEVCRAQRVALGMMFQQRLRPAVTKIRRLIDRGVLGERMRVEAICSSWTRTQAYYDAAIWRGTWNGEGGGVLMNQAPHTLDLFILLGGMPTSVFARLQTRIHKIEVENTADLLCGYARAEQTGHLYVTTAQAPGVERFLLVGDKASMELGANEIRMARLPVSLRKHLLHSRRAGSEEGQLDAQWETLPCEANPDDNHVRVADAFARHILEGTPLVADGDDGIRQVELTNAAYISDARERPVELPISASAAERCLAAHARQSRFLGTGLRKAAMREMSALVRAAAEVAG